jgi:hypothetical protein
MTIKELKKLPNLVLLNSEGNILTAYKTEDKFYMVDMDKKTIGVLTQEEIVKFTNGDIILTSSKGEVFFYTSYVEGMRPKIDVLNEFIYGY